MRFKLDENLPVEAAAALRSAGQDAATAGEERLGGAANAVLLGHCRDEGRVLVTLDVDFANIRRHPPSENTGLVVLRLRRQDKASVLAALSRLLTDLPGTLVGLLCVVDETTIRVHD